MCSSPTSSNAGRRKTGTLCRRSVWPAAPGSNRILETIDPKIILCVGRIAAQQLFDPHFRVTRQHGELREWNGRLVMATFHPAALLRNPSYKPMMEETLRKLAALAAEKQNAQIL